MRNGVGGAGDARRCGEYGGGTEPKMERGRYLDPRPRRSSTERNQRGGRGAGQNRGRMRRGSSGPQSGEVEDGGEDVEGEEQGARGVLTPPPSSEGAPCHDARPEKIGCATSRFRRARARHGQVSQRASMPPRAPPAMGSSSTSPPPRTRLARAGRTPQCPEHSSRPSKFHKCSSRCREPPRIAASAIKRALRRRVGVPNSACLPR